MALRKGHGNGAGSPRIEVLPVDELPAGVPGPEPTVAPKVPRGPDGRFTAGDGAKRLGARGGRAKRAAAKLAASLGMSGIACDESFAPYRKLADAYHKSEVRRVAREIGGGHCSPAVANILATSALQRACSAWMFDRAAASGDATLMTSASRLGNDSRQNALAAHELAAREAENRPQPNPLAHMERLFEAQQAAALPAVGEATDNTPPTPGDDTKADPNG